MAPAVLSSRAELYASMGEVPLSYLLALSPEISRHHGTYAMAKGDFSTPPRQLVFNTIYLNSVEGRRPLRE